MSEKIGYFGVMVPKFELVQGFFLTADLEDIAKSLLTEMHKQPDMSDGITVTVPFTDGATPLVNQMIGTLASTVVVGCLRQDSNAMVAAMALSNLIGTRFFYLLANHDSVGGMFTNIGKMPPAVTAIEDARKFFYSTSESRTMLRKQMMQAIIRAVNIDDETPPKRVMH